MDLLKNEEMSWDWLGFPENWVDKMATTTISIKIKAESGNKVRLCSQETGNSPTISYLHLFQTLPSPSLDTCIEMIR